MTKVQKRRADALANRERILDIARKALAEDPYTPIASIAKAAEVGQGTFYRHYPTREALILAVYRHQIDELVKLAPDYLIKHAPLEAFHKWCETFVKYGREKLGIVEIFKATMAEKDVQEAYWPLVEAMRQLLTACKDAGEVNSDTDPEDIITVLALLLRIPADREGQKRTSRIMTVLFNGLETKLTKSVR